VAGSLPIVGRAAERAVLSAAYARAAAGEPQMLLITGAAGIGRTRLAEELCQLAGAAGAQIRAGESAPLAGAALAYGPFVAALGEQATWLLDDDGPGGMLAARHRLFLRVLGLLGELAASAPLALRLEDLHWADESSRELLAFLAVRLRDVSVLLVATVREEDLDSTPRRWAPSAPRVYLASSAGPGHGSLYAVSSNANIATAVQEIVAAMTGNTVLTFQVYDSSGTGVLLINGAALAFAVVY
jgi:hypothetical protein